MTERQIMKNQANFIRPYYYGLLGGFGGLTGWFVNAVIFRGVENFTYPAFAFRGLVLGGLIGLSVAAYDGMVSRSLRRFGVLGLKGLLLGAAAGAISLPLAQWLFARMLPASLSGLAGAYSARLLLIGLACWVVFGGVIGFVEVVGKGTQSFKGLAGGVVGGLVGGGFYEAMRPFAFTQDLRPSQNVQALSLTAMGLFIGLSIAFITTLLRSAWIEVLDGKFAGHPYDVTKYVSRERGGRGVRGIVGSDELRANIYLPADKEVLPQHAILCYANEAPTLLATPEAQKVDAKILVNNYAVSNWPLSDGDEIQIGTTRLRYHQSRKAGYN